MTEIPARINGRVRTWLESPSPPRTDPARILRTCAECDTWCVGENAVEAADRLAEHRRRRHG